MDYLDLTIKDLHKELVLGHVTPEDLTKEAIRRAKCDSNNAFEYIAEKEALDFAKSLKTVEKDNLLWGIPFVAKDNFSTKDIPTTGSSNILAGYVPVFDSTVIAKLKEKKAILIGKTTLDELAMGGTGTTGHLGTTFNPYDPSHTHHVGGSSCGSAASCADSIVPFALGSDTGDSIRKPASYAGLVGFKPTWGRISRYGVFPFAPSMDHVGYFTRSVFDSAVILNAIAGKDNNDFTSSAKEVNDYTSDLSKDIKGTRIAIIKEIIDSIDDKDVLAAFERTVSSLKIRGAIVEFVSIDRDLLRTILPTYFVISCAEATSNNANLDGIKFGPFKQGDSYVESMFKARTEGFGELIKRRFVLGSYALFKENQDELFLRAQKNRRRIVNAVNEIFKSFDVIYVPASPTAAPRFDQLVDKLSDKYLIGENHLALGNFGGFPSITVPIGFSDKLPFGANIMGKTFDEVTVLKVAQKIEDITGYYNLSAKEAN